MSKSRLLFLVLCFAVFSSTSALSFFITPSKTGLLNPTASNQASTTSVSGITINPSEPKDQLCPTNGLKYTNTEKKVYDSRIPILVMIENAIDARPQSGLSSADIVYETVAEGGVTRFMGVFYCNVANAVKVAPVRSARIYFVNIAAEYNNPVYLHVGGGNCSRDQASGQCTSNKKAWALEELQKMGWRKAGGRDFDTTFDIGAPVLTRDYFRLGKDVQLATEHTMVGNLISAWREADKRGLLADAKAGKPWADKMQNWKFVDDASLDKRGATKSISFGFWKGWPEFDVTWEYDKDNNSYKRSNGGKPQVDLENNQQITAKNIVVQFAKQEGPIDDHKHMLYQVIGNGKAIVYQNGQVIDATWKKSTQTSRTVFSNKQGKEIEFVRGQTWIEILPLSNEVVVQ